MTTANEFRGKRIIAAALCTAPFALGSVLGPAGVAPARRRIAATSAIFSVTVAVAAMVATPAAAEPRQPGQAENFQSCFMNAWNKKPTMSYAEKQQVAEECCLNAGGTFNEKAHVCYLGVDNITVEVPNPPPPPPTRATIAPLPPGATNVNPH